MKFRSPKPKIEIGKTYLCFYRYKDDWRGKYNFKIIGLEPFSNHLIYGKAYGGKCLNGLPGMETGTRVVYTRDFISEIKN